MKTVATFNNNAEASVCAAMLGSAGIETLLLDDGSYGGHLTSMTSSHGIRLQVDDQDFEEALRILQHQKSVQSNDAAAVTPHEKIDGALGPAAKWFRRLIWADLLLTMAFALLPGLHTQPLSAGMLKELNLADDEAALTAPTEFYLGNPLYAMHILTLVLLYARVRLARWAYAGVSAGWLALPFFTPPSTSSAASSMLVILAYYITGALLALMFSSLLSAYFQRASGPASEAP